MIFLVKVFRNVDQIKTWKVESEKRWSEKLHCSPPINKLIKDFLELRTNYFTWTVRPSFAELAQYVT